MASTTNRPESESGNGHAPVAPGGAAFQFYPSPDAADRAAQLSARPLEGCFQIRLPSHIVTDILTDHERMLPFFAGQQEVEDGQLVSFLDVDLPQMLPTLYARYDDIPHAEAIQQEEKALTKLQMQAATTDIVGKNHPHAVKLTLLAALMAQLIETGQATNEEAVQVIASAGLDVDDQQIAQLLQNVQQRPLNEQVTNGNGKSPHDMAAEDASVEDAVDAEIPTAAVGAEDAPDTDITVTDGEPDAGESLLPDEGEALDEPARAPNGPAPVLAGRFQYLPTFVPGKKPVIPAKNAALKLSYEAALAEEAREKRIPGCFEIQLPRGISLKVVEEFQKLHPLLARVTETDAGLRLSFADTDSSQAIEAFSNVLTKRSGSVDSEKIKLDGLKRKIGANDILGLTHPHAAKLTLFALLMDHLIQRGQIGQEDALRGFCEFTENGPDEFGISLQKEIIKVAERNPTREGDQEAQDVINGSVKAALRELVPAEAMLFVASDDYGRTREALLRNMESLANETKALAAKALVAAKAKDLPIDEEILHGKLQITLNSAAFRAKHSELFDAISLTRVPLTVDPGQSELLLRNTRQYFSRGERAESRIGRALFGPDNRWENVVSEESGEIFQFTVHLVGLREKINARTTLERIFKGAESLKIEEVRDGLRVALSPQDYANLEHYRKRVPAETWAGSVTIPVAEVAAPSGKMNTTSDDTAVVSDRRLQYYPTGAPGHAHIKPGKMNGAERTPGCFQVRLGRKLVPDQLGRKLVPDQLPSLYIRQINAKDGTLLAFLDADRPESVHELAVFEAKGDEKLVLNYQRRYEQKCRDAKKQEAIITVPILGENHPHLAKITVLVTLMWDLIQQDQIRPEEAVALIKEAQLGINEDQIAQLLAAAQEHHVFAEGKLGIYQPPKHNFTPLPGRRGLLAEDTAILLGSVLQGPERDKMLEHLHALENHVSLETINDARTFFMEHMPNGEEAAELQPMEEGGETKAKLKTVVRSKAQIEEEKRFKAELDKHQSNCTMIRTHGRKLAEWLGTEQTRLAETGDIKLNRSFRHMLQAAAEAIPPGENHSVAIGLIGDAERCAYVLRHYDRLPETHGYFSEEFHTALADPKMRNNAADRMEKIAALRKASIMLRYDLDEHRDKPPPDTRRPYRFLDLIAPDTKVEEASGPGVVKTPQKGWQPPPNTVTGAPMHRRGGSGGGDAEWMTGSGLGPPRR